MGIRELGTVGLGDRKAAASRARGPGDEDGIPLAAEQHVKDSLDVCGEESDTPQAARSGVTGAEVGRTTDKTRGAGVGRTDNKGKVSGGQDKGILTGVVSGVVSGRRRPAKSQWLCTAQSLRCLTKA